MSRSLRLHRTLPQDFPLSTNISCKAGTRGNVLFENFPEIGKAFKLACQFRSWYARENINKHLFLIDKKLFNRYEAVDKAVDFLKSDCKTNAIAENLNGRIKKFIDSNYGVQNRYFFFFRINFFFLAPQKNILSIKF